jgi:uncharacterized membrane protein YheB (UPF0754 family)
MLYALPFIGALIGWLTNYIAVKMLFHPRNEIRFLFLRLHGVFPRRQKELARRLGEVVSGELLSGQDIQRVFKENAYSPEVVKIIQSHVERTLCERLPEVLPALSRLFVPDLTQKIKASFSKQLGGLVEIIIDEVAKELDHTLDVQEIVEEKVATFSCDKLEEILFAIMKKEFVFIEVIGAILGFLIGLVQVILVKYSLG